MKKIWILIIAATLISSCEKDSEINIEKFGETIYLPNLQIEAYNILPPLVDVHDAHFLSETSGLLACDDGMIEKTTDPRNEWISIDTETNLSILALDFINSMIGFASTDLMMESNDENFHKSAILKTEDGGNTWTEKFNPEIARIWDFKFFNENEGIAFLMSMINDGSHSIAKTSDGGTTWNLLDLDASFTYLGNESTERIFVQGDACYIIAGDRLIYKSEDYGNTWETIIPPIDIWRACFISSAKGFIINRDQLYFTENSGINWTEIKNFNKCISAVHFFNRDHGYCLHYVYETDENNTPRIVSTVVIYTSDGGLTWNEQEADLIIRGTKTYPSDDIIYKFQNGKMYIIKRI